MIRVGRLHRTGGFFAGPEKIGDDILDDDIVEMVMLEVADSPVLANPVPEDAFLSSTQLRKYPWARVWGFRGEGHTPEQVECKMIASHEGWMPMA